MDIGVLPNFVRPFHHYALRTSHYALFQSFVFSQIQLRPIVHHAKCAEVEAFFGKQVQNFTDAAANGK